VRGSVPDAPYSTPESLTPGGLSGAVTDPATSALGRALALDGPALAWPLGLLQPGWGRVWSWGLSAPSTKSLNGFFAEPPLARAVARATL
jgi:hypothetical protein